MFLPCEIRLEIRGETPALPAEADEAKLQYKGGVASCFRYHRGATFASSALMAPMTEAFVFYLTSLPLTCDASPQRRVQFGFRANKDETLRWTEKTAEISG